MSEMPAGNGVARPEDAPRPPSRGATEILADPAIQVIFAVAPAGLGHLRVTEALYQGLHPRVPALLLGAQDEAIRWIHRVMSVDPTVRALMEWVQRGRPQAVFTFGYRSWLRARTGVLLGQIETLIDQRLDPPETILVVATHFGLAHQLAALKARVRAEKGVRLVVVVQVTDDSPQSIWYVPGADLICVPSEMTRAGLIEYGHEARLAEVPFAVLPYPVAPELVRLLDEAGVEARAAQMDPELDDPVNVCVPVSGAAVGLPYAEQFVDALHDRLPRTRFHVVSKTTPYTGRFLGDMAMRAYTEIHAAPDDRAVVRAYDEVYTGGVVGLEVTKPSEQAFKALVTPERRGGAILLLTRPVGRQEFDNLDFLHRHHLVPTAAERDAALGNDDPLPDAIRVEARHWRALALPDDPVAAATVVARAHAKGLLAEMASCRSLADGPDPHFDELRPDGVARFWERVAHLVR